MCTSCHEAFCKDCTELIKFDAVDAPQRMCDLCSKVGYCPSVGSADDEELPTRLTEEDLIEKVDLPLISIGHTIKELRRHPDSLHQVRDRIMLLNTPPRPSLYRASCAP
ncbi:hypothetical protein AeNC1_017111 [Aphanomyces euteiches]|nr:hypothetical protein AeNC1_017111 [Aphanomyces euteiches]